MYAKKDTTASLQKKERAMRDHTNRLFATTQKRFNKSKAKWRKQNLQQLSGRADGC